MRERIARIKLLAMDVDGTLTDGGMTVYNGEQIKTFNVYDGLGIRLAMNYGLNIAWITGNSSQAVAARAHQLGVEDVCQGSWFKSQPLRDLAQKYDLDLDEIAYIGDDLNDLPAFEAAGVCFAVDNAANELKDKADVVTARAGGHGAVREAIETILKARGQWDDAVDSFLTELKQEAEGKPGPEAVG